MFGDFEKYRKTAEEKDDATQKMSNICLTSCLVDAKQYKKVVSVTAGGGKVAKLRRNIDVRISSTVDTMPIVAGTSQSSTSSQDDGNEVVDLVGSLSATSRTETYIQK